MILSMLQALSPGHFQFHMQKKKNSIEKTGVAWMMRLLYCMFPTDSILTMNWKSNIKILPLKLAYLMHFQHGSSSTDAHNPQI